jgi:hypothetical protein
VKCEGEIPEGRLKILPNTKTCVSCSDVSKKGGITVQLGEGDHTYNEVIIMEPEEINMYNHIRDEMEGVSFDELRDEVFPSLKDITVNMDLDKSEIEVDFEDLEEEEEPKEEDEDAIS